jgi:bis(5'-nucleosyl)-tetraphosphatase (symmetrical)
MARWAIGDVQGCYVELRELLRGISFTADRDELWFVGDLVNRGPASLDVLRFVRALGAGAQVVLGNHDLHLLAVARGSRRKLRDDDTLAEVLGARDRDTLLDWLQARPLAHFDAARGDLLIHAGLVPQWAPAQAVALSREVTAALALDPRAVFDAMYGDEPRQWDESLHGFDRLRFAINALTRMRYVKDDGTLDLKRKGAPQDDVSAKWKPWFEAADRRSADVRVIFGHWSTLGLLQRPGLLGLDTGCVWGGTLTACRLDGPTLVVSAPCASHQAPGGD